MSPLKLIIPGRYWDSQIYRGRLHLFGMDGEILTLDWDELIENLRVEDRLRLAVRSAFQRSDFLYGVAATGIFDDVDVREIMIRRFHSLSEAPLEVGKQEIDRTTLGEQGNLFPFPHADSEIYNRRLFVSSANGVFAANCNGRTKYPVSTGVSRIWEMPVSAVRASYGSLALAAGEEGLWQYNLDDSRDGSRTERVASQHCSECQWVFHSIYGSSSTGCGLLASYRKHKEQPEWSNREEWIRTFDRIVRDIEIFSDLEEPEGEFSWAAQDKICQASNGSIRVVKYEPWNEKTPLRRLGVLPIARHGEAIVSAKVALFGTVVELDSGLVVIGSDGTTFDVRGEPVSWRVFPRSRHYENHLHVIHDDRLEVLSFNHDYLIDQNTKVSGISFGKRASSGYTYSATPRRGVASQRVAERPDGWASSE